MVAVLYFDNDTNQREYDVLQKGLAVGRLQVVERQKLQSFRGLRLNIDPRVPLGRHLGGVIQCARRLALGPVARVCLYEICTRNGKAHGQPQKWRSPF